MGVHRFAVLLWRDFSGQYAGCAVEDPEGSAAAGPTRSSVLEQIKDYYTWVYKREPWRQAPEQQDAELTQFKVQVRPEYGDEKGRLFPSEPVGLLVACVHGKVGGGVMYGSVPRLGVSFHYQEGDKLKETVTHYVQRALKGRTTAEVAALLPPQQVELEEVLVSVPREARKPTEGPRVKTLEGVADPISSRRYRSGFSRAWEREAEVARLTAMLGSRGTNVILVGPAGVGKTTVLVEAARKAQETLAEGEEGEEEKGNVARVWLTSGPRLIAGMQYLGQWQERVEKVVGELSEIGGILCVERLLDVVLSGSRDPAAGIGAYLAPYLQRGELRLVAEATAEELDACRRLLPSIVDACQIVHVGAMGQAQALEVLEQVGKVLGQQVKVVMEPAAAPLIYRLFHRFEPYRPMPGAATAFLGEVFDLAVSRRQKRLDGARVDEGLVREAFIRRTGLPEWLLRDEVTVDRERVLADFGKRVIGQAAGRAAAADVLLTFKAGMNDPGRPLGVLLFAGPTGVGKTEMAKALAGYLFGNSGEGRGAEKGRLVRLDMSEYSGPGAAERFLGPPEGEPSELVRRVRQQPFCVVLLDEIEKASPEVFDLLLGVFDEGRLTDRYGRLTTFRSAVVIMTSNLGATAGEAFGLSKVSGKTYASEIAAHFRPEFFNRIDAVVTFEALGREAMVQIAEKELREVAGREGLAARAVRLTWTAGVVEKLLEEGFDARYGARPLQRAVETLVVTPLAKLLAGRALGKGTVFLEVSDGAIGLRFEPE
jgi:ATP-dependent Clp protease ATP-binding subunit ClpC